MISITNKITEMAKKTPPAYQSIKLNLVPKTSFNKMQMSAATNKNCFVKLSIAFLFMISPSNTSQINTSAKGVRLTFA